LDDQLANRIHRFVSTRTGSRASTSIGEYSIATTLGLVRNENQDAAIVVRARYGGAPNRDFDLSVVCDGLGGMKSGGDSALLGLSCFVSRMIRSARIGSIDRVTSAIGYANAEIFKILRGNGGTTLSAILVSRHGPALIGHAGDSRIYAIDHNDLQQLTQDDTLEAVLNRSNGQTDKARNSRLIQFVGIGRDLEPHVYPSPTTEPRAFLLTSDGAHDMPHSLLRRAVVGVQPTPELAKNLIQLSESLGGQDNATVVVVPSHLSSDDERPSEGLDLAFMSPFGRLDVWIPQLLDDRREILEDRQGPVKPSAPASGLREENSNAPQLESAEPPTHQIEEAKSKEKQKRSKKKKPRKKSEDDQLSLPSPSIDVQFPEREEDK
jgi:PPM family protein phosphatase